MLVSKPNINKQVDLFGISTTGFIINQSNINLNDLIIIYFSDILNNDNLKTNENYNNRINFFDKEEFKFNEKFMTTDNFIKQIDLININVNEQLIKDINQRNNEITIELIIQFFNKYIEYLVDNLNFTNINNKLEIKYKLLLKNSELSNFFINYQSDIITNIRDLYNELSVLK